MNAPIWTPSPERVATANLTRFMEFVARSCDLTLQDYDTLHAWSVKHPERFWPLLWEFCGIRSSKPWQQVLTDPERMPGARWFPGARLNFAENLLRYRDEQTAIVFRGEDRKTSTLSYAELYQQVAALSGALRQVGVVQGDRVAGFMPNLPETVIAMLATTALGAIWTSCSPDFGINGVVDRFGQTRPKVLFCADGCFYGGKTHYCSEKVRGITQAIPSIEQVVIVPCIDEQPRLEQFPRHGVLLDDFVAGYENQGLSFVQLPFDHPLYILYSSGTTGVPKCIVHGAGNTLIQHLKELVLHTDLRRDDHIFYYTTCGWMMWNWLVSSLAVGATVVLYDGSPFHNHGRVLLDLIDDFDISIFGTSAKYISALEKVGLRPRDTHQLDRLRTILSTGSPLLPENFAYIYQHFKDDVALCSISGGTDIVSCFCLGNPLLPVYAGELQCAGLGMKVQILDPAGQAVREQKGELACAAPFPSMPVGFWDDHDGKRYHAAYFERVPGKWCHGDHAEVTAHNGYVIYGRSDTTLNPGGVRIGTAEIYRQVEKLPEIMESLAVGQHWHGDERVVLFVVLREGLELDDKLRKTIADTIRSNTTPRHVPAKIIQVRELPRTISGKMVELAVREVIHGRTVNNADALANPESLRQFKNIAELQQD